MPKPYIIQITGPTGAGKSTVSELLAKKLEKCANIEADHVKHFTKFGFYKDTTESKDWHFNEWLPVGEAVATLAALYASKGLNVIINGYISESAWKEVTKQVTFTHKFLLLPTQDALLDRDANRTDENKMGEYESRKHHTYFTHAQYFNDCEKIDSSQQTAGETATLIIKRLGL